MCIVGRRLTIVLIVQPMLCYQGSIWLCHLSLMSGFSKAHVVMILPTHWSGQIMFRDSVHDIALDVSYGNIELRALVKDLQQHATQ